MELFQKVPVDQSEIAEWSALPKLDMPELYYCSRILSNNISAREASISEIVNRKSENGEDLKTFIKTCKDSVDNKIKSLEEAVKVYSSIEEWSTLENLTQVVGLVVEEIIKMVDQGGEDKLALEPASLPEVVKALLEQIPGWILLPNKVKVVLTAEAVVKLIKQAVSTICYGKSYISYEEEFGEPYKDKVQSILVCTTYLFTSIKKITLSADKIWPELAGILQEKKAVLEIIIKQQQLELLKKSFQKDKNTILGALKKRLEWLDSLEKNLDSIKSTKQL